MKFVMAVILASVAIAALAQNTHSHDMNSISAGSSGLKETGQAAFASIAEATRTLEEDPQTDWSKVKISALRDHLVDMDNVTMRADVATATLPNGARFRVTSDDPPVRDSITRMAHMHSAMARQETSYAIALEDIANGVAMTVTGSTAGDAARIRGLGFFGLMAEGNHHQRHHLALAKGEEMHQ